MICKSQQKSIEMVQKLNSMYEQGKKQGYKDGMSQAIDIMFYSMADTLYMYEKERITISDKRIKEIMHRIFNEIDCYRTGQLSAEDFNTIKENIKEKGIMLKEAN